jgi:hypothetical protein
MNTMINDLYKITINSSRYQSLNNQYIQLIKTLETRNEREIETIEDFILFLVTHTRIRKVERVGKKQLIVYAKHRIKSNKENTSENILREVVKTLTALKRLHRLHFDVSLKNYVFWSEVFS